MKPITNGDERGREGEGRELIIEKAGNLPRPLLIAICLAMVLAAATLDYLTGQEVSINFIYLIPIALAAWAMGTRAGVIVSLLSAGTWVVSDYALRLDSGHGAVPYWNTFALLLFFLAFSVLLARLRYSIEHERELSRTDALTGACNTRCFHDLAQAELDRSRRYGHPFSLAYLDVDDFKQVNDSFGHTVGDQLLKSISTAMLKNVRASDIVARLGGDEFAVLLPETGEEEARAAVEKLRQEMISAFPGECRDICSFSIGLVTFNQPPATVEDVIQAADQLMYEVKTSTKDAVAHAVYPDGSGPENN